MTIRRLKTIAIGCAGFAVGILFLWLALRDTSLGELRQILRTIDPFWIVIGMLFYAGNISVRILRWHRLLSMQGAFSRAAAAISLIVGYSVNNLLPARLGEVFRADLVKRRFHIPGSVALGAIVVERLFDLCLILLLLYLGLLLTVLSSAPDARAVLIRLSLLATVLLVTIVGALILFSRGAIPVLTGYMARRAAVASPRMAVLWGRAARMLVNFNAPLRLNSPSRLGMVFVQSSAAWLFEAAALYAILRAVGIALDPGPLLAVLAGANLSTLIPTAPGYVGTYQLAYVIVLGEFGIGPAHAIIAATCAQIFLLGGLTVTGAGLFMWEFGKRRIPSQ
ncbi:MAG: flippase-like domain-containing protein [Rhodospirillales bacterium]|nr:flippase-like domain-containing protein [Rhodospirillales bacterium]